MSVSPVGFASAYRRAPAVVRTWSLDKRVEAEVYAVTVHLRANEHPIRRCPRPDWMPEPWQGEEQGEGVFAGPSGTAVP